MEDEATSNSSDLNDYDTAIQQAECEKSSRIIDDTAGVHCNSSWDTVSCWPATVADSWAKVACPDSFEGVKFLTGQNATRFCHANGTWEYLSNYANCVPNFQTQDQQEAASRATMIIYYTGFSFSIIALLVALTIFLHFKMLRCLRNTIHCHLMLTFLMCAIVWIAMSSAMGAIAQQTWMCKALVTVYNYLLMTNYFWMFVEGLYLTTVIVMTFSAENHKFWYYAIVGYGIPCPLILAWVIMKVITEDTSTCWLPSKSDYFDYIYMGPILLALCMNCVFFITILWVLITKLKASSSLETRGYRKAARATLVLIPLLGITYILFITPPSSHTHVKMAFTYIVAILQSTQGLWISIFYCFLNGEVRQCLMKRFNDWQDVRTMTSRFTRGNSRASSPSRGQVVSLSPINGQSNGQCRSNVSACDSPLLGKEQAL